MKIRITPPKECQLEELLDKRRRNMYTLIFYTSVVKKNPGRPPDPL